MSDFRHSKAATFNARSGTGADKCARAPKNKNRRSFASSMRGRVSVPLLERERTIIAALSGPVRRPHFRSSSRVESNFDLSACTRQVAAAHPHQALDHETRCRAAPELPFCRCHPLIAQFRSPRTCYITILAVFDVRLTVRICPLAGTNCSRAYSRQPKVSSSSDTQIVAVLTKICAHSIDNMRPIVNINKILVRSIEFISIPYIDSAR